MWFITSHKRVGTIILWPNPSCDHHVTYWSQTSSQRSLVVSFLRLSTLTWPGWLRSYRDTLCMPGLNTSVPSKFVSFWIPALLPGLFVDTVFDMLHSLKMTTIALNFTIVNLERSTILLLWLKNISVWRKTLEVRLCLLNVLLQTLWEVKVTLF